MQYLSANNIANLTLKHQGVSPTKCDGFTGAANYAWAGLTSVGQGARVDPAFIFNEVKANSAIEYDAVRYNMFGQPAGGHAMDIIGAGTTNGVPWILYVSDHLQTGPFPYGDPYDKLGTINYWGGMLVDFSYLVPSNQTPNQQPILVYGQMSGALAVAVITQHP